jgi:hypothetical protein
MKAISGRNLAIQDGAAIPEAYNSGFVCRGESP